MDSAASDSKNINREAEKVDDPEIEGHVPFFNILSSAITTNILLRLTMKSLLICKCVCKRWRTLISDPQFADSHLKHAQVEIMIRTNDPKCVSRALHLPEFEPDKFASHPHFLPEYSSMTGIKLDAKFKLPLLDAKIVFVKRDEAKIGGRKKRSAACKPKDKFDAVNSCSGLLCLCCATKERNPLLVCNPITGEFIRLPEVRRIERFRDLINSGFGFHPRTNHYKVIRVYNRFIQHLRYGQNWWCTFAEIHTVGTGIWESVGRLPFQLNGLEYPTWLNGALHWLCVDRGSIISFNYETEKFQSIPSPPGVFDEFRMGNRLNISMGELWGCLYICDASCEV